MGVGLGVALGEGGGGGGVNADPDLAAIDLGPEAGAPKGEVLDHIGIPRWLRLPVRRRP